MFIKQRKRNPERIGFGSLFATITKQLQVVQGAGQETETIQETRGLISSISSVLELQADRGVTQDAIREPAIHKTQNTAMVALSQANKSLMVANGKLINATAKEFTGNMLKVTEKLIEWSQAQEQITDTSLGAGGSNA